MSLASSMLGNMREGSCLPIARRGLFAQDDFFSGFQKDYSSAVGDVLDRWRSRSSLADRFASYRKLRERDTSEDSQAATVSESPERMVIVIDMSDYSSGQITVKTEGFSAVVDGKAGQQVYHRKFPLPRDTHIDGVVVDLSDDSILTVTAPRKGKGVAIGGNGNSQRSNSVSSSVTSSTEAQVNSGEERIIPTVREGAATCSVKSQESSSSVRRGSTSRVIPLNVEGQAEISSQTSVKEAVSSSTSQTEAASSAAAEERIIPTVKEGQTTATTSTTLMSDTAASAGHRELPIRKRGRFFQDSTFERVWGDFESAIDDLMQRRGSRSGADQDKYQTYRNLRKCIQQDDNQASKVNKTNDEYKIVVDVKDFVDGHLDVKAEAGAVLVIGKKGPCSFERRFSIPSLSQPENVAAALSSDGVLTITAPVR